MALHVTVYFLKFNLLGWHWLIRSHRCQVHISMVLCVPTTWSQIIFYHHVPPFPLVNTIVLSGSMSFCLFFSLVCCSQFHILHRSKSIWFLTSDFFRLVQYSWDSFMLQMGVFNLFFFKSILYWLGYYNCLIFFFPSPPLPCTPSPCSILPLSSCPWSYI